MDSSLSFHKHCNYVTDRIDKRNTCPTQNKQISLPQIILTQSPRQNTSITTMPPLQHQHTRHIISSASPTCATHLYLWADTAGVGRQQRQEKQYAKKGQETLLLTYNALGKSIASYVAPVWSTNANDSSFKKIQRA